MEFSTRGEIWFLRFPLTKGVERLDILKSCFVTDRLGKRLDALMNRMRTTRALRLLEKEFSGKSKHNACGSRGCCFLCCCELDSDSGCRLGLSSPVMGGLACT